MDTPRNNTSVLVAALAACLGLLIAGAVIEVSSRQAATQLAHVGSPARLRSGVSVTSSLQVHWTPVADINCESESPAIPYQNRKALIKNDQVLIVTRLPRAGLSGSPAKPL